MSTITIKGNFSGNVNNFVILDVFRPNSLQNHYDFRKTFERDFEETLTDLLPGLTYNIDFTGFTTANFEITISGDFDNPNPIEDSVSKAFSPGYAIQTT
ncbi:hypothetical protein [Lacibacter sediminis]|uniref:Uncharacterized protein n=1 Tax=Lacibacter sediminis TaxID=2760713 RepID=A0A7G5XKP4_9BACT|nr:hypothetical protein [Lacibacter sediminis]QNA46047.1 hypothetical protein H4075_07650 [Lacibacter sediminis]